MSLKKYEAKKRTDLGQPFFIQNLVGVQFLLNADFWALSDLKRKYAGAPNQIAVESRRIRYVENPNSGVVKAKII